MDVSLVTALGLGLTLGLRHALDADHVAAVSTLVARERGLARSCLLGAFWGAGHTLALLGAGIAVIAFKLTITPGLEAGAGTGRRPGPRPPGRPRAPPRPRRAPRPRPDHTHGGMTHRHRTSTWDRRTPAHVHLVRLGGRPFLVGLLHGLAGSAALTLLVLGTIPSPIGALVYILVFGVGSTAGMLLLSGLVGLPVALAAPGAHRLQAAIQVSPASGARPSGSGCSAGRRRPETASRARQSDRPVRHVRRAG